MKEEDLIKRIIKLDNYIEDLNNKWKFDYYPLSRIIRRSVIKTYFKDLNTVWAVDIDDIIKSKKYETNEMINGFAISTIIDILYDVLKPEEYFFLRDELNIDVFDREFKIKNEEEINELDKLTRQYIYNKFKRLTKNEKL